MTERKIMPTHGTYHTTDGGKTFEEVDSELINEHLMDMLSQLNKMREEEPDREASMYVLGGKVVAALMYTPQGVPYMALFDTEESTVVLPGGIEVTTSVEDFEGRPHMKFTPVGD